MERRQICIGADKKFKYKKYAEIRQRRQKNDEELQKILAEVSKEMEEFKFSIVAEKLYHYFWHTFADIIIERSKKKIIENNNADSARNLLLSHLTTLLKALHPFIPFVTEEIWQILLPRRKVGEPTRVSTLMVEKYLDD